MAERRLALPWGEDITLIPALGLQPHYPLSDRCLLIATCYLLLVVHQDIVKLVTEEPSEHREVH